MAGVTVKYRGNSIKNQISDGTFKLSTNGKMMSDDVRIETDESVTALTVSYSGNTILTTSGEHVHKLSCKDKVMSGDVNFSCQVVEPNSYITFSSPQSFTLAVINNTKNWDGKLEYSTDTTTWTEWDGTSAISSVNGNLYLRGSGNAHISEFVLTGSDISCSGKIESLIDYVKVALNQSVTVGNNAYKKLFKGCVSLTDCSGLIITSLSQSTCEYMFRDCTSLTTAPALPATTLTNSCYFYMFNGCTSLTTAPALPATTLANSCYSNMFNGCTSLTTAPALPATTLANSCYSNMFRDCTSLTTAPALPATTLTDRCYNSMFNGCTSLTTAPALPATTLAEYCYNYMFSGCTSLTTVPALPATTLTEHCYSSMFYGCTLIKLSLTQTGEYQTPYRIPSSGTGTVSSEEDTHTIGMFNDTGGTFTGTPTINTTYYTSNTVVPATST